MAERISLKDIVKSIDETLKKLDDATGTARSVYAEKDRERAKRMLKGIKETLEGMCNPGFDFPDA